jgi:hypothetical protein
VSRWLRIRTVLTGVENRYWMVENRIRNQSELHVIDPNPSLTFSLIGIASTKRRNEAAAKAILPQPRISAVSFTENASVVDFDFEQLTGANQIARHFDVRLGRRGLAPTLIT